MHTVTRYIKNSIAVRAFAARRSPARPANVFEGRYALTRALAAAQANPALSRRSETRCPAIEGVIKRVGVK